MESETSIFIWIGHYMEDANKIHLHNGCPAYMRTTTIQTQDQPRRTPSLLIYPLETPKGTSLATLVAMPRLCTTSTTSPEGL